MNSTLGETDAESVDVVNFLTQSPVRVAILQRLRETDRLTKAELREEADASRVTVQRNLDALEGRELIRCRVREYEIRPLGEVVAEELDRPVRARQPPHRGDGARRPISVSAPGDRIAGADGRPRARRRARQSQEVVHSATLESTLRSEPEYRELVAEIRAHEACTMRVADRELTYYLGLFDDVVQIGVEDDDGIPRALVETDAAEIRAWAAETYERHLEQSAPLSL
ncbi:hypothetical protein C477_02294 [Haloterrigena salina JCM 13891]|uniref:Uncharacterized protein n=1 Tax=Haloterrigena salina JCM 13891 TaxID=1227488 RepID=M0CJ75_9EURY|nr:helix-turn-helix transcriptional regulator [Haloterrigena salina]ELZ23340.1 hypothetical protein C477_02294 [Haloterrigena salina JCM 13891]